MSERECSIDGCGKQVKTRGWCSMHYERWRKNGNPLSGAKPTPKPCFVDGCDNRAVSRGLCGTHDRRLKLYGDPRITTRRYREYRRLSSAGYVMIYEPEHPLAQSHGYVMEHRKVMYDAGVDLTGLHVHHIDGNKANNAIENLEVLTNAEHGRRHGHSKT